MKADHQSYRRAMIVCLWGWIGQSFFGLLLLIFALIADNPIATSGAGLVLIGSVVWFVLAILFDAHRRERIEAMEAEALDESGAREGSVFETGEELRVAAKRLAWMHKWLVPAVSIGLALAFALFGAARLGIWPFGPWSLEPVAQAIKPRNFTVPEQHGLFIALGLGLAIGGFIFARFVSGMAKQSVWTNLRGGAAQAAGMALIGLALAVCHFLVTVKVEGGLRYLSVILPIASIFAAVEILLNFVLTVYRPRRPGEFPRPSFDSRILAFVAAPDRIAESFGEALNYQFGIDVTSSWFYQLLSKWMGWLLALGAVVTWLLTVVAVVRPNEEALLLRWGSVAREPLKPGLHFKYPWPMDRVRRYETTSVHRLDLASGSPTEGDAILWTKKHTEHETYLIVRSSAAAGMSKDVSLVSVETPLFFVVKDLEKFVNLAPGELREDLLQAVAQRVLMQVLARRTVDDVLGVGRAAISQDLMDEIQSAFDAIDAGVQVTFVGISGAHPPIDAAQAFEAVVQAEQNHKAMLEQAEAHRIERLSEAVGGVEIAQQVLQARAELETLKETASDPAAVAARKAEIASMIASAGGDAAMKIHQAEADRWQAHMSARARLTQHKGQTEAFRAAPIVYVADRYFRTLRQSLDGVRLLVIPEGAEPRFNLEDADTGANPLLEANPDEM